MELRLDGKVALITGASRGIGAAMAEVFAHAGAQVMLSSRKQDALDAVSEAIDGDTAAFAAHVGQPDAAHECIRATIDRFGGLDILVNNAATNPYLGPTVGISESQFDKTVQVNLKGPLLWTQRAVEAVMGEKGGVVLNTSSIGGMAVEADLGVYNATKAGLIHMTQTLAYELGPRVRVNSIAPGLVKTDLARALWEPREAELAAELPLGRLGEPVDIAHAALFLVSDAASWITGHTLVVDGGAMVNSAGFSARTPS